MGGLPRVGEHAQVGYGLLPCAQCSECNGLHRNVLRQPAELGAKTPGVGAGISALVYTTAVLPLGVAAVHAAPAGLDRARSHWLQYWLPTSIVSACRELRPQLRRQNLLLAALTQLLACDRSREARLQYARSDLPELPAGSGLGTRARVPFGKLDGH